MKKLFIALSLSALLVSPLLLTNKSNEVKADAPSNYYASINSSMKGDDLKVALYNIIKGHTKYGYKTLEVAMKITDRDYTLSPLQDNEPDDYDPYMKLLYADYNGDPSTAKTWKTSQGSYGTTTNYVWNKEHIWAKSNGFGNSESCEAYSDLHHLRASDWKCNNTRSNFPFANVSNHNSSTASYDWTESRKTDNYLQNNVFEPRDSDKGDVARALFYMATRYYNGDGSANTHLSLTTGTDSSGGKWGYLDTLLAWHELDPVDEFEAHRNDLIYGIQGNRNPYIDHPEYARAVFKNEPIVEPDTLIDLTYSGTPIKTKYKQGEPFISNGVTVTATFRKKDNSTYTKDVSSNIEWSNIDKDTSSVTGTYTHNSISKSITIDGLTIASLISIFIEGIPNKTVYEVGDTFEHEGLTLYANYDDLTTEDVTSIASWQNTPLTKGQMSIEVSFGGLVTTYLGIHVKEKSESSNRIEFDNHSKDGSSAMSTDTIQSELVSGSDIATISSATNIYAGTTGLKFSSSKKAGSLIVTLKKTTDVTKLVFNAKKYSSDSTTVTVAATGVSSQTFTPTSSLTEYVVNINESISSFTISSPNGQRFYLSYIDVYSGSGGSSSDDVITSWGIDYLFIGDTTFDGNGIGLCRDGHYYHAAKVALMELEATSAGVINNLQSNNKYASECARYLAWSLANHDNNPFSNDYSFLNSTNYEYLNSNNFNINVLIIIAIGMSATVITLVVVIIVKRKRII